MSSFIWLISIISLRAMPSRSGEGRNHEISFFSGLNHSIFFRSPFLSQLIQKASKQQTTLAMRLLAMSPEFPLVLENSASWDFSPHHTQFPPPKVPIKLFLSPWDEEEYLCCEEFLIQWCCSLENQVCPGTTFPKLLNWAPPRLDILKKWSHMNYLRPFCRLYFPFRDSHVRMWKGSEKSYNQ